MRRAHLTGTLLYSAILSSFAFAQEVRTFTATLGGQDVGKATVTLAETGEITSESAVNLLGNKSESTFRLHRDLVKHPRISFSQMMGGQKADGWVEGKNLTVVVNGKETLVPGLDASGLPYMTLHPGLFYSWGDTLFTAKTGDKLPIFSLDNSKGYSITAKVSEKPSIIDGVPKKVRTLIISIEGIDIEVYYSFEDRAIYGIHVPRQRFSFVDDRAKSVVEDPVDQYKELSPSTFQVTSQDGIDIPMRDGTILKASLRMPATPGKYPTILMRSPYSRSIQLLDADWWAKRGYAVLAQDVRGTGESKGEWDPYNREVEDGFDTLEWISKQPWSDSKVGMIGASYGGSVQWSAAVTGHPALRCIIPQVSPPDPMNNMPYENGVFFLAANLWWSKYVHTGKPDLILPPTGPVYQNPATLTRPVSKVDDVVIGKDVKFWNEWLRRRKIGDWKGAFRLDQIGKVKIPVLHVSGVWDGDGVGTKLHWEQLRKSGGNQWVVFGPWPHGFNASTSVLDEEYGPQSLLELNSVYLRFFDTYLKGKDVGQQNQPRVRMFITGANRWEKTSDFPFPDSKLKKRFLSGTNVLGSKKFGSLSAKPGGGSSSYVYDPNATGPTLLNSLSMDQSTRIRLGKTSPMLVYRTEPFVQPKTLTGPMEATLYFSTTAKDASLHVFVFEQQPDGRLRTLGIPGAQRVTYKNGDYFKLRPEQIVEVKVRPWWFAHEFGPGSRLAIGVFSDARPLFAPIPGTGEFEGTATTYVKAKHKIHTSAKFPSSFQYYESE